LLGEEVTEAMFRVKVDLGSKEGDVLGVVIGFCCEFHSVILLHSQAGGV